MMEIVDPQIEKYCIENSSRPSDVCEQIDQYTKENVPGSQMLIGPMEASLLRMLLRSLQARKVLEIGCYTGYSALAMAEVLPEEGKLVTLDVDAKNMELARSFWQRSPHGSKIEARLGQALETMQSLESGFDLIFVDADKTNYQHYIESGLSLLSSKGVFVVDNCLWSGRVLDPQNSEVNTQALRAFNQFVHNDPRFEVCLLPVRDGVSLIRPV